MMPILLHSTDTAVAYPTPAVWSDSDQSQQSTLAQANKSCLSTMPGKQTLHCLH